MFMFMLYWFGLDLGGGGLIGIGNPVSSIKVGGCFLVC